LDGVAELVRSGYIPYSKLSVPLGDSDHLTVTLVPEEETLTDTPLIVTGQVLGGGGQVEGVHSAGFTEELLVPGLLVAPAD